jgi:Tol biopolymer transport system component
MKDRLLVFISIAILLILVRPHASTAYQTSALSGKITYVTTTQNGYEVAVYDIETETNTVITNTKTGDSYLPRWSPDGKTILYIHDTRELTQEASDSATYTRTFRLINRDGTEDRLLNEAITDPARSPLVWSLDGQYLLLGNLTEMESGLGELLYTLNFQDETFQQLPFDYENDHVFDAVWTAENQLVVIMADGIYKLNADGSDLERILEEEGLVQSGFDLSPTGETLAIQVFLPDNSLGLELVDLATGEHHSPLAFPVSRFALDMVWSPNGEAIALFIQEPDEDYTATYVADLSAETPVWELVGRSNTMADWSPDSQFLIYAEQVEGSALYIRSLDAGGEPTLLFDGYGAQPDWNE